MTYRGLFQTQLICGFLKDKLSVLDYSDQRAVAICWVLDVLYCAMCSSRLCPLIQ